MHEDPLTGHFGKKATTHHIKKLKNGEEIIIHPDQVLLRTEDQEYVKEMNVEKKKTRAERIHENLFLYINDLKQEGIINIVASHIVVGNNWEEKIAYLSNVLKSERSNKQTNNDSLELYFQIGELLDESEWSDIAKNELNLHFKEEREKW
ncbi:2968_t:CDS:2, partial [Gigaspora margarita]